MPDPSGPELGSGADERREQQRTDLKDHRRIREGGSETFLSVNVSKSVSGLSHGRSGQRIPETSPTPFYATAEGDTGQSNLSM